MDLHKIDGRQHSTTEIMFLEFQRKIHDQPRFRVVYWNDGCFTNPALDCMTNEPFMFGIASGWQRFLTTEGFLGEGALNSL